MAEGEENNNSSGSFFNKVFQAGNTFLDSYITKARAEIQEQSEDLLYGKSVDRDITYPSGSQGFYEKKNRLSYDYLWKMSIRDTIVAAVIQTFQNKIASHAVPCNDKGTKGFRIRLKNEEEAIEQVKARLFPEDYDEVKDEDENQVDRTDRHRRIALDHSDEIENIEPPSEDEREEADTNKDGKLSEREKRRYAKKVLQQKTKHKIQAIQELVLSCGSLDQRPFESKQWDFDSFLRALVRDSLTYDQMAVEMVYDEQGDPHHWKPVDGGTIRYASPSLNKYSNQSISYTAGYDILFPEEQIKQWESKESDALNLDEDKLENNEYKYVQVINGRVERAFTEDELFMGMRNPTTNIYQHGYPVCELELLARMVASHIFTENYNHSYFSQGFSAKGILHIKKNINRRKLESIRTQWNHMLKGNRNSFQTPIMAGMEDVQWIPLTQRHSDMEFSNWMNYLIKVICSIYQIDPVEIGFGMKEEGGEGTGGLNGDNTQEKFEASRNKGMIPMLRFLQRFINKNIIDRLDPDYMLEFVGVAEEDQKEAQERQEKEVRYKKSVNEVRAEDDLEPIPGADDLILDQTYFQWFMQFHPEGEKLGEKQSQDQTVDNIDEMLSQDGQNQQEQDQNLLNEVSNQAEQEAEGQENNDGENNQQDQEQNESQESPQQQEKAEKSLKNIKPLKIEYYYIGGDKS